MAVNRRFRLLGPLCRAFSRSSRNAAIKEASRSRNAKPDGGLRRRFWANCNKRRKVSRYEAIVCALALRWVSRRIVKNDSSKDGKLTGSRMQVLPSLFQPLGSSAEQFRRAGQVPIRVRYMGMPQIGGKH